VMLADLTWEDPNTTRVKIAGRGQLYRERHPTMCRLTSSSGQV
jgi:hypothetical protein